MHCGVALTDRLIGNGCDLELVGYTQKEVDAFRLIAIPNVVVAVDIVVELEEYSEVGLRVLIAERLRADSGLVLTAEAELDNRFECALKDTGGIGYRDECGATADKAIVGIERPMFVDTGIDAQACVPFSTVVHAFGIDLDLRVAGFIEMTAFVQILVLEGFPKIVVSPEVDIDDVLVVVGERSTNLTAAIIGVEVGESTGEDSAIDKRDRIDGGDSRKAVLLISISTVDVDEQITIGADMEAELCIDRGISADMVGGDTRVDLPIRHTRHIVLECPRCQAALCHAVDGEPFLGNLRLKLDLRRWCKSNIIQIRQELPTPDIDIEIDAYMDRKAVAKVGIVWLDTQCVAGIKQGVCHLVGLQKGILHKDIAADMVDIGMPVDIRGGANLMLGDILRQGKERISDLRLVLNVGFIIALYSYERIDRPYILLILGLQIAEMLDGEPFIAIVVATIAGIETVGATDTEIEVASRERMAEIEADACIAVGTPAPLCPVIGIDIEDAILAVVEMVSKIEEGIGMPQTASHESVVGIWRDETHRLAEQRVAIEGGCEEGIVVGIVNLRLGQIGFYHLGTDIDFARRLHHGLELPLDGNIAVERRILLRTDSRNYE